MAYNNPYLSMMPAVQQALNQQTNPMQQQILQSLAGMQQAAPMPQQVGVEYVTKDEFNKLMEENEKLKNQLEKELTQRADMEFFKKEQEVLTLEEGKRAFQEVEYQKAKYYDLLWRTSPVGQETIQKYRDAIDSIYSRYTTQPQIQQPPAQAVEVQEQPKQKAEEQPTKKYNVVNKPQKEDE